VTDPAQDVDIWYNTLRMKRLLLTLAAFSALALFAERQPYERYQSIVDRQMFGQPPPGFDPTRPPSEVSKTDGRAEAEQLTKEQEQIKSAIHFSVINVTPGGETAVGFTDNGDSKNPVHYYLKVGESRNGWLVKEADPVKATMTIARGDVEVSLSIGGNSASQPGAAAKAGSSANASANAPASTLAARPALNAPGSLRGRRMLLERQRQEAAEKEAARKAEETARREEERRIAAEEKAQREAELEAEREERRAQLQQIRDELRRDREARAAEAERDARPRDDNEGEPSE